MTAWHARRGVLQMGIDTDAIAAPLKQKGALIKACLNKSTDFAELIKQYGRYL